MKSDKIRCLVCQKYTGNVGERKAISKNCMEMIKCKCAICGAGKCKIIGKANKCSKKSSKKRSKKASKKASKKRSKRNSRK